MPIHSLYIFRLLGITCLGLLLQTSVAAADIVGKARVINGDTLVIADTELRLFGVYAPHLKQTCISRKGKTQYCGELARQALSGLLRGRKVTCKNEWHDENGVLKAVCFVGPLNINEHMVADGWALAYRKDGDDFVRAETFAKARKEGIWKSQFTVPWDWKNEE